MATLVSGPCQRRRSRLSTSSGVARGAEGVVAGEITHLLPHLPQALQTMEQVAAPQQLAAKDTTWCAHSN